MVNSQKIIPLILYRSQKKKQAAPLEILERMKRLIYFFLPIIALYFFQLFTGSESWVRSYSQMILQLTQSEAFISYKARIYQKLSPALETFLSKSDRWRSAISYRPRTLWQWRFVAYEMYRCLHQFPNHTSNHPVFKLVWLLLWFLIYYCNSNRLYCLTLKQAIPFVVATFKEKDEWKM